MMRWIVLSQALRNPQGSKASGITWVTCGTVLQKEESDGQGYWRTSVGSEGRLASVRMWLTDLHSLRDVAHLVECLPSLYEGLSSVPQYHINWASRCKPVVTAPGCGGRRIGSPTSSFTAYRI